MKQVSEAVYTSDADIEAYKELDRRGITLTIISEPTPQL